MLDKILIHASQSLPHSNIIKLPMFSSSIFNTFIFTYSSLVTIECIYFIIINSCYFYNAIKTHERFPRVLFFIPGTWTSLVAQTVKCLSTMRETRVRALGWEDPLEKEIAIHSSTIAWKIPWTEEPGRLQSMGSQRVGHDWATSLTSLCGEAVNTYHLSDHIWQCWPTILSI